MRISAAFPSDYLKAADLDGRNVMVKMDRVEMRDIGGDHKPVLYFLGKEKGVVLNKTNSNNIALAYGDDTDDWHGKEIVLFEAMVDFQGKTVSAIRVRTPQAKDRNGNGSYNAGPDRQSPQQQRQQAHDDMDSDIPF